ncbi:hypothetical protein SCWH03_26860 [Streptomyces pacificus]|uniref:Uncharacterized protein n=1 Tax=Streptomyces pacificus TaxID=2705029 RepID=A0A6A0AUW3_9ACTN|nr:hypothetical protein SCWH03_26860 [Streptomyces pacificus]
MWDLYRCIVHPVFAMGDVGGPNQVTVRPMATRPDYRAVRRGPARPGTARGHGCHTVPPRSRGPAWRRRASGCRGPVVRSRYRVRGTGGAPLRGPVKRDHPAWARAWA